MGISEDTERSVLAIPLNVKETNMVLSSVLKCKLSNLSGRKDLMGQGAPMRSGGSDSSAQMWLAEDVTGLVWEF